MNKTPVTDWIGQLANQESHATEQLWEHFSERMHRLAHRELDSRTRRSYDEHDAANSAFHSLCRGINEGRFEVSDRDSLWALLAVITSRKVAVQRRFERRQKRGGGQVRGDSVFLDADSLGFDDFQSDEPTPEFTAMVAEACQKMLESLEDPTLRRIAILKFEGCNNGEVAHRLERSRRTIERKLEVIRRIWVQAGVVPSDTAEFGEISDHSTQSGDALSESKAE
ncbi:MAG: ECF-type sigma factor [Fuerstiella sp.]